MNAFVMAMLGGVEVVSTLVVLGLMFAALFLVIRKAVGRSETQRRIDDLEQQVNELRKSKAGDSLVFQVMSRGDHGETIFNGEEDSRIVLKCQAEFCWKTDGWTIPAPDGSGDLNDKWMICPTSSRQNTC